jgi:hypothetical protein
MAFSDNRVHVLCHPEDIPPLTPTSGSLCRCTPRAGTMYRIVVVLREYMPSFISTIQVDERFPSAIFIIISLHAVLLYAILLSISLPSPTFLSVAHCSPTVRPMALALPLREPPAFLNASRSGHLQSQPTRNQPASSLSSSPSCHPNPHTMGLEKTPHTLPDRMSPPSSRTSSLFPPR